ncbi:TrmH family RNA methyltransferase [Salegentibacter sp. F188]|uniref:TrmH family RNA methyltransferase n=1 Tax=Autumnicola patrickiae TaxID=3075591 RepID=A0ABU3E2I3_9FLAO|nr:TrmH family RNA methyltransferase [Salegentibacter sp. F188]MDT0690204.1 TrmH family RNA methyltransferase [Salegentibacter sp. F188]
MKTQLSHQQSRFKKEESPVILILDNVSGEANIGSIFRLADAFGIEKIVFCGTFPNLSSNRLKRTARNTHEYVKFKVFEQTKEAVQNYENHGYTPFALEITAQSTAIETVDFKGSSKISLIVGNEANGIQEEILSLCKNVFHIEMFGNNSSMNVAQATAIALYEIRKSIGL